MAITVLEGDFGDFANIVPAPGGIKYWAREPGQILPRREFAASKKLEFLDANETGGGTSFDPLMGAVGAEVIGPAGLLLGSKRSKIRRTVYFKCTLEDGRYFIASVPGNEFDNWRFMLTNKNAGIIIKVAFYTGICLMTTLAAYLMSLAV